MDIFQKIDQVIEKAEKRIQAAAEEIALIYYNQLVYNIENNAFGFSIKDSTKLLRRAYGVTSDVPLKDTGEYVKSIIIEGARVTVAKGIHSGGRISYEELSYVLEYGRKDLHIPQFPVWRLTFNQVKPKMLKFVNTILEEELR